MAFSSKTSLINMDQNNFDEFYRYKFEAILTKYEGKNSGKVTVIMNIYNIASNVIGVQMDAENGDQNKYSSDIIHKTADHITKFIRKKVSGQCKYHKSSKQTVISGRHEIDTLQNYLFKYVKEYAQCPKCTLFELTPAIQPNVCCKSCGWKQKGGGRVGGGKKKKQKKRKKKKNKKPDISEEKDNDDNDDNDDNIAQKIANDPIFAFNHYLNNQQQENIKEDDVMEKIKILSIAHKLDRKEQIKLVMYCLLDYDKDDHKLLLKSIQKYSSILETFTLLNDDTPILLSYMEQIIMQKSGGVNLVNHAYQILHCLYDEDIVGEDELIEWHQTVDNKHGLISKQEAQQLRTKAHTFIKWLEEAEEDEDEDGD